MQHCNSCNQDKPASEFYWSKGYALTPCKACRKAERRLVGLKRIGASK